jgi:hypothetical protein
LDWQCAPQLRQVYHQLHPAAAGGSPRRSSTAFPVPDPRSHPPPPHPQALATRHGRALIAAIISSGQNNGPQPGFA